MAFWIEINYISAMKNEIPESYKVEHNPDEYLNNDVKAHLRKKPMPRSGCELKSGLRSYMRCLQWKTDKVARFFDHENARYAKA